MKHPCSNHPLEEGYFPCIGKWSFDKKWKAKKDYPHQSRKACGKIYCGECFGKMKQCTCGGSLF